MTDVLVNQIGESFCNVYTYQIITMYPLSITILFVNAISVKQQFKAYIYIYKIFKHNWNKNRN